MHRIHFQGFRDIFSPPALIASFAIADSHVAWTAEVVLEDLASGVLSLDRDAAKRAAVRVGLPRLLRGLADGQVANEEGLRQVPLSLKVDGELLGADPADKNCRYQVAHDGSLYCGGASANDTGVVGRLGLQRLSPTTRGACSMCEMPAEPLACSALCHPSVLETTAINGPLQRVLTRIQCEDGREEVGEHGLCVPGGNHCWHRTLNDEPARTLERSPLTLSEAADFLDAVWRLRFKEHLLPRTPVSIGAGLAVAVATPEDFKARMSDLAALLEFRVPDGLLPPELPAESQKRKGSINRLEIAILNSGQTPPETAIRTLRAAIDVRNSLQHPGQRKELQAHLEHLGARPVVDTWGTIWDVVQQSVTAALIEVRNVVRDES